jgi:hypothetical protein
MKEVALFLPQNKGIFSWQTVSILATVMYIGTLSDRGDKS